MNSKSLKTLLLLSIALSYSISRPTRILINESDPIDSLPPNDTTVSPVNNETGPTYDPTDMPSTPNTTELNDTMEITPKSKDMNYMMLMTRHKKLLGELQKNLNTQFTYFYLVRKLKYLLKKQVITVNKKVELAVEGTKFRKYHKLTKNLLKQLEENVKSVEEYLDTTTELPQFLNEYYTKLDEIEKNAYKKVTGTFNTDMARLVKNWGEKRGEVYDAQMKVQEFVQKNDRLSAEAVKADENLEEKLQGEFNILKEIDFVVRYARRQTVGLEKEGEERSGFARKRYLDLKQFEDLLEMSKVCERKGRGPCMDL